MSAGIGGIGNLGVNPGVAQTTAVPTDPLNYAALTAHHKKHKAGDTSFEAMLSNLNAQKVSGIQSGSNGQVGTRVNKYA
jgi:hypothetical protein